MEHHVYICSWSQSSDGYTLWVRSQPHVRGAGVTYIDAERRLMDAIQEAGGALHAVLEFVPSLPMTAVEGRFCSPEIFLIVGDDRFETDAPRRRAFEDPKAIEERLCWLDSFYEKPVCRGCRCSSGRRSEKEITLTHVSSKCDGAFGCLGHDSGPTHQIFSLDFLALLTSEEKNRLQFQPTRRKRGRPFFELVGPQGLALVAVAGLQHSGWRCPRCDHRLWGYWSDDLAISAFVARSDLIDPLPGVFTVGVFPEIQLAVTAQRWREWVGRPGTRGLVSTRLGVVPDHEVVRRPELQNHPGVMTSE